MFLGLPGLWPLDGWSWLATYSGHGTDWTEALPWPLVIWCRLLVLELPTERKASGLAHMQRHTDLLSRNTGYGRQLGALCALTSSTVSSRKQLMHSWSPGF